MGVKYTQTVDLHCSCRMPEEKGDKMAECDVCKTWYHQHCMDIPSGVFGDSEVSVKHAVINLCHFSVNSRCDPMYLLARTPLFMCSV